MKQYTIKINGMTCAACVKRVEKKSMKIEGVSDVAVNLATNSARVELDETVADVDAVVSAIETAGYEVADVAGDDEKNATVAIRIGGMTCAACVSRVEKKVGKLDGVDEVAVNLATGTARITYDPSSVSMEDVRAVVEKAGYAFEGIADNAPDASGGAETFTYYMKRFVFAAVLSAGVFGLSMPMMLGAPPFMPHHILNWVLLALTTPVIFFAGWPFYRIAAKNTLHLTADMNSLVAMGTGAAYLYSALVTVFPGFFASLGIDHVYYEAAALIITFILLGKAMEARAKSRAAGAINKLLNLAPKTAILVTDDGEKEVPAADIGLGDIIRVKPGGAVPVDGIVRSGRANTDESMLTGEARPVTKEEGAMVFAGTIVAGGSITFEATRIGRDTTLAAIIRLVEEATSSKAPVQRLADTVAGIFVPIVLVIAIVTLAVWLIFGPEPVVTHALVSFVSVLIIACPCAMGLATPTAIMVSTGVGAAHGILIKNGATLERAGDIDIAIFDKTGTLTSGRLSVRDISLMGGFSRTEILRYAASVESVSEHPLATAVLAQADIEKVDIIEPESFESFDGKGVTAKVGDRTVVAGRVSFLKETGATVPDDPAPASIHIAIDGVYAAAITVDDAPRDDAHLTIQRMKKLGVTPVMLSGDHQDAVRTVAEMLDIKEYRAELMPKDKLTAIREYQANGHTVAMIGDGINDAAALAAADVGISVSTGTDVAIEASDITIIGEETLKVPLSVLLSRKTLTVIKQNLFWAFIYNIIGIPIAAGVLYPFFGLQLNPVYAGLAMAFSSVSVVTNSLRLKRLKLS